MPGAGKKRAAAQKKGQSGQGSAGGEKSAPSESTPGPSSPPAAAPAIPSFDGAGGEPSERLMAQPSDSPLFSGGRALELGASAWTYIDAVSALLYLVSRIVCLWLSTIDLLKYIITSFDGFMSKIMF